MRTDFRLDTATKHVDPPLAVADLDAFQYNADQLVRRAGGLPVRIATKSVRCVELLRRAVRRPGFAGLMCYSLSEALWLYRAGLSDDILVGYPTVDAAALRELASDPEAARCITIVLDSVEHLDLIDRVVGTRREALRLCLEADVSWRPLGPLGPHIGTRRSPIRTAREARALTEQILGRRGFRLVGIMAYEGQIAGLGDDPAGQPLRAAVLRGIQRRSALDVARRRAAIVTEVRSLTTLEFVNGGGTGSLERTSAEAAVTEVAAGSGLIGPTLFDNYRAFQPRPAVLFALPVVRRPTNRVVTLFGGGYLASGTATADRLPSPYVPGGLALSAMEGAGEVQTPVLGTAAGQLRLGDRVWFRHAKAGELAERFTHYHLVSGDQLVEVVPTYRGAGKSFG